MFHQFWSGTSYGYRLAERRNVCFLLNIATMLADNQSCGGVTVCLHCVRMTCIFYATCFIASKGILMRIRSMGIRSMGIRSMGIRSI